MTSQLNDMSQSHKILVFTVYHVAIHSAGMPNFIRIKDGHILWMPTARRMTLSIYFSSVFPSGKKIILFGKYV